MAPSIHVRSAGEQVTAGYARSLYFLSRTARTVFNLNLNPIPHLFVPFTRSYDVSLVTLAHGVLVNYPDTVIKAWLGTPLDRCRDSSFCIYFSHRKHDRDATIIYLSFFFRILICIFFSFFFLLISHDNMLQLFCADLRTFAI